MPHLLAAYWMPDAETLGALAPEFTLLAGVVALLVAPLLLGRDARMAAAITFVATLGAVWLAAASLADPLPAGELFATPTSAGGMILADGFYRLFRLIVLAFLAAIVLMWLLLERRAHRHGVEFLTLLLCSALGMILMAGMTNLVMMIVAIELASMPSYILAGFDRRRKDAAEAAMKYVLFGAACTGLLIYGVSLAFGLYGTAHIPTLVARLADGVSTATVAAPALAMLLIFVGLAFKVSAAPFHFWCPDVFEGAPLPIATWLSVASKAAGLALLFRVVGFLAAETSLQFAGVVAPLAAWTVAGAAILTSTWANFAAVRQQNVRRLLAYSAIAHAGYMIGAGAIVEGGTLGAAAGAALIQYFVIYALMNFGAFMVLGLVAADSGSERIESFRGMGWRDPAVGVSMTLCLAALIGLPPMGGFIAKWWLLWALGDAATNGSPAMTTALWVLVFAIVLNTALSLTYYGRIFREMFLRGDRSADEGELHAPLTGKLAVHACAVLLLLTGTLSVNALKTSVEGHLVRPAGTVEAAAPAPDASLNAAANLDDPLGNS